MSAACINAQVFLHDRFLFIRSEKNTKTEALNQLPLKHQAVSHLFYLFIFLDMYFVGLIYTKENTLLWLVATYLFQLM